MKLAWRKVIPPKEWLHDPYLCNHNRETVAMILAK